MAPDIGKMESPMDYESYFAAELTQIERALDLALPTSSAYASDLIEAMRYGVIPGGKRIRPLVVLCVTQALGGDYSQALFPATALELLHCYTLIHDDLPCMDDDAIRRGQPTVHVKFGEATALLAGDALLTLAFEQASYAPRAPARIVRLLAEAAGAKGVIAGQVEDLRAGVCSSVSEDVLTFIHTNKTAELFRAAAGMGAYAAGKGEDENLIRDLMQFGVALGMAFQYVDDLLDARTESAFSSVSVLGVDKVQTLAHAYTDQALGALTAFGESAEPLRVLTRLMLKRGT